MAPAVAVPADLNKNKKKLKSEEKEKDHTYDAISAIILGTAAMTFALASIKRTLMEMTKIEMMWAEGTTIKQLQEMVDRGDQLPSIVLVKGIIDADGPPVGSITGKIPSLNPLLGMID